MAKVAIKTIVPAVKNTHDNSTSSSLNDFAHHTTTNEPKLRKISTTSLKDKGLLVPARLALKRQRPMLKLPVTKPELDDSDGFQIELGRTEDFEPENSQERKRLQTTPHNLNSARECTPYTIATDISVRYKEKTQSSHPVSGQYVSQYIEDSGSPSPCSYVLPRRPYREKNAPAYTFGSRYGGARTGWQKQWFAHTDPYTTKVDFDRETAWPSPFHYQAKPSLGNQTSKVTFPAWSLAARLHTNPILVAENNPSPDTYNTISAFHRLTGTNTFTTLKSRTGGTQISAIQIKDKIPGPGAHDSRRFLSNKHSAPKHSFGVRWPTSLGQDPYVNTLPPLES
ncbi:unnamed protein product [Adineta ricciae]|uniref:Uncharacterized protein n=1 Tax=Adineta ricciae TaxID=249248 RepID=A0A813RXX0_ADIRI|nr:unnamed protein product [Adineta ricciae]